MNKRIKVPLPETTMAVLAKIAPPGDRSQVIDRANRQYVTTRSRRRLRAQLKQEALANADRDLVMAAEWFYLRWAEGKRSKK